MFWKSRETCFSNVPTTTTTPRRARCYRFALKVQTQLSRGLLRTQRGAAKNTCDMFFHHQHNHTYSLHTHHLV